MSRFHIASMRDNLCSMSQNASVVIRQDLDNPTLNCVGLWTVTGLNELDKNLPDLSNHTHLTVDASAITKMDSAGAVVLNQLIEKYSNSGLQLSVTGLAQDFTSLMAMVTARTQPVTEQPARPENFLYRIGQHTVNKTQEALRFLEFLGEYTLVICNQAKHWKSFAWKGFLLTIEQTGFRALGIIALLNFLIGIVLVYQMGLQLKLYGANIYIVNVAGIAILREFAPLITAIITAGRSSSSFTAQLGMMKLNEEIDALKTMGISPMQRLMIPRILGLIVSLPLLTVWACAFGVLGSMYMAKISLGINYSDFISRFNDVVSLQNYLIGICKTPVFAWLIACIGCFQGMQVSSSAESVGLQTTKSVVQAIFLIIIADALFSIFFSWQGI